MESIANVVDTLREQTGTGRSKIVTCEKHGCDYTQYDWGEGTCPLCDAEKNEHKERLKKEFHIKELKKQLNLPKRFDVCTIANYKTVTKQQQLVKDGAEEYIAKWPDIGGMVMIGGVGTGKTHIAAAICTAVCELGCSVKMTTVNRIIRNVRAAWNRNTDETEAKIIEQHSNVGLLVIDEIGSQYGSDSEKIIINEIINDRYENMLPTIVIGNLSRTEITELLGVRVYDRIMHNGIEMIFNWKSERAF
jgi:DNA replication protein DnaC